MKILLAICFETQFIAVFSLFGCKVLLKMLNILPLLWYN